MILLFNNSRGIKIPIGQIGDVLRGVFLCKLHSHSGIKPKIVPVILYFKLQIS